MSPLAARFLCFLSLFAMAFAPLVARAGEMAAQPSVTTQPSVITVTLPAVARTEEKMIHPADFAEWGLLLADVLLTVVGIFIAIVGAWGYYSIRAVAQKSGQDAARKEFKIFLESSDIKKIIVETVKKEADTPLAERVENEQTTNEKGEGK